MRLDHYLIQKYSGFSRSFFQKYIKMEGVKVNGARIKKPHFEVSETDRLEVTDAQFAAFAKEILNSKEAPRPSSLKILFEDAQIIVIDKAPGVTSEALTASFLPVHRLDKDTSGVLVMAKTLQAQAALQKQWQDRVVKKVYIALLKGKLEPKHGAIEAAVGRQRHHRTAMSISSSMGARSAFSEYRVKKYLSLPGGKKEPLSLVHIFPHTGRTHQIRVHFKSIGNPVVGDFLYGDKKLNEAAHELGLTRQFLHAMQLKLAHPLTHKKLDFVSELAKDCEDFLKKLGKF